LPSHITLHFGIGGAGNIAKSRVNLSDKVKSRFTSRNAERNLQSRNSSEEKMPTGTSETEISHDASSTLSTTNTHLGGESLSEKLVDLKVNIIRVLAMHVDDTMGSKHPVYSKLSVEAAKERKRPIVSCKVMCEGNCGSVLCH